jgi:hypothetical protein
VNNGNKEMAALVVAVDGDLDFELSLGEFVGKWLRKKDQAIRDREAAELLPLGREVAAARLKVKPGTVYKMMHRHRRRLSTANAAP